MKHLAVERVTSKTYNQMYAKREKIAVIMYLWLKII